MAVIPAVSSMKLHLDMCIFFHMNKTTIAIAHEDDGIKAAFSTLTVVELFTYQLLQQITTG